MTKNTNRSEIQKTIKEYQNDRKSECFTKDVKEYKSHTRIREKNQPIGMSQTPGASQRPDSQLLYRPFQRKPFLNRSLAIIAVFN